MDYNTHQVRQPISTKSMNLVTGTWTNTHTLGAVPFWVRTVATSNQVGVLSFTVPQKHYDGEFGLYLKAIEIPMLIPTQCLTAVLNGHVYRINSYLAATTAAASITGTSIPLTQTGTSATVFAATTRLYTATITTPAYSYSSTITKCHYNFQMCIPAACTTAVKIYDAYAIYDDLG